MDFTSLIFFQAWKKFVPATNSDTKEKSSSPKSSEKSESSSTEKATKGTYKSSTGFYEYDGTILSEDEAVRKRDGYTEKIPKRNSDGVLIFKDEEEFRPNMTPKEVLQVNKTLLSYLRVNYSMAKLS